MTLRERDNGLQAQAYAPLADLEPRLADTMLALLRDSGIAAYVVPVGDEHSGRAGTHTPGRPADRLHVDADATEPARQVLRAHLPSMDVERDGLSGSEPSRDSPRAPRHRDPASKGGHDDHGGQRDEDEIWREIVAAYDSEPSDPVPPWPASEDLDDGETRRRTAGGDGAAERGGPVQEPATDPDDEHFVPPPPPPVPRPDPATGLSWLSLLGGPTYLLISTMTGSPVPDWAAFAAVAAFIGGFVALVVRMGDEPPQDSGPDDGAVV